MDELRTAFDHRSLPVPPEPLFEAARARAAALALTVDRPAGPVVAATYVSEILGGMWVDSSWSKGAIDRIVRSVAGAIQADPEVVRAATFVSLLRSEYLYELPPRLALEAQLRMLTSFGAPTEASLWTMDSAGVVTCVLNVGAAPSRRAAAAARLSVVTDDVATSQRAQLQAVPVRRWNRAEGAVVIRAPLEARLSALGYASECARAARPLLELETLLERHADRERSLEQATDRKLTRLGLDLHDGPMQDIAALSADLRLYRKQLEPFLHGLTESGILLGRLDDLEARLVTMDSELRALARSLQEPTTLLTPFRELLRKDVERFQARSSVGVSVRVEGELDTLTSSQKIALLRVIQEALNNVHEHSGARSARVHVTGSRSQLEAEIYDDGTGFDVEANLIAAAKAGRLGLVGMSERVRLLGGRLDVESTPGGPTRVRASVPRWQPLRPADAVVEPAD